MMRFETLDEIAKRAGTDKQEHGYTAFYDDLFFPIRFSPIRMLEIGFAKGRSAKMFAEFFPMAVIHVLDHSPDMSYYNRFPKQLRKRIIVHQGDQGSKEDIGRMIDAVANGPSNAEKRGYRQFHVIIDDGCHVPSYQIKSFEMLWEHLAPGGYYVIEDMHVGYEKGQHETMEYFMEKVHHINSKRGDYDGDIEYVSFPYNLIVTKRKDLYKRFSVI
jgi:8-demethyl-8-(2-methoxy-alpha-L-rhamnosyl)tetracenomycin-C 3'-O-methyltransferase